MVGWRLIHARAFLLTDDLVAEDFDFYGRTLSGHRADPRPLEARRLAGRGPDGRGGRPSSTSSGTSRRRPRRGWTTLVDNLRRGLPGEHRVAGLDERRRPGSGRWPSSTSSPPRSATRTSGATTRRCEIDRDDLHRQRAAAATRSSYDRELAKLGGPVDRDEWFMTPQTVNAYYNPRHERDRLPRRDPAAAVLRRRGRRRRELRRHRRGDRPRDRPRLRRPGRQVRRRRQPRRLVDRRRPRRVRARAPRR